MRTTQPGQSALLLLDVLDVLAKEKTDYAVVGAMAASVHGAVRASLDADAVAFVSEKRARDLLDKLTAAGLASSLRVGDDDDPIPALLAIEDKHGNRVDLLIGLRGLESAALDRAIDVPFQGTVLKVLGREDFIATKLFAGGPQDLADAEAAMVVHDAALNVPLLRRLATRFGAEAARRLDTLLRKLASPPA